MERSDEGKIGHWWDFFDEDERRLITSSVSYAAAPAGFPGHNLLILIAHMHQHLEQYWQYIDAKNSEAQPEAGPR